jgi:hypothetical protein
VHLICHHTRLNVLTCGEDALDAATHVALEFTTQKNGVRGELVGLGRSGHPVLCPVLATVLRLKHLRLHSATPHTPIYQYHNNFAWGRIATSDITQQLRLNAADISVRSLRSSGAMALLCAEVDTDRIRLLGRWRSDEMLRYLHIQALPIVVPLANQMVRHGYFSFIPNNRLMG